MSKHDEDDGFRTTEEAYQYGQMDAQNIQTHMADGGENPYLSPEEAMDDLEKVQGNELMESYYRGYLSRWD